MYQIAYFLTVYDVAIEEVSCWGRRAPVRDITCIIFVTLFVRKFGALLSFVDIYTIYDEEILMWDLIYFENIISLKHDRFMRVMHEIFYSIF